MTGSKTALIMAGGPGGHIFPGLAVAEALRARGWRVPFFGAPPSMEARIAAQHGFALESVTFSGVRGKGLATLALLPLRLLRAFWQARAVLRRVQPDVLVGLGGYISFPGALMGLLRRKPLVLHEQNAVAGLANRLRAAFTQQAGPAERFAARTGPLQLLVMGGSLGARALNELVPQALALLPAAQRPQVLHQSGATQIEALRAHYAAAGVQAELRPFIDDVACALAAADVIVCRAGASTVSEIAAVGAAALFVPLPSAVDDHQTRNPRWLVDPGAAWLLPQHELSPRGLAQMLSNLERPALLDKALKAHAMQKTSATQELVGACEELAA